MKLYGAARPVTRGVLELPEGDESGLIEPEPHTRSLPVVACSGVGEIGVGAIIRLTVYPIVLDTQADN